jgi:hypothetical protein
MMQRKKIDVDVVRNVLTATLEAFPKSGFVAGLLHQYDNLGGLSRKQMEDLYTKAAKIPTIKENWLATLEAEILKKPVRYKSPPVQVQAKPVFEKNEAAGNKIAAVLAKYPQHKRVLFLQSKYDSNEVLSPADITELERFFKVVSKS